MAPPKVKHLGDNSDVKSLARGELPVSSGNAKLSNELAEVMDYDSKSNSYIVLTRGAGGNQKQPGGKKLSSIPRKVENPGLTSPLPVGTVVVISYSLGFPYIDGVLNINTSPSQVERGPGAAGNIGGATNVVSPADNTVDPGGAYYRQPGMPEDLVPGDMLLTTPEGNRIGALRGNYNVMDAGPQAKAKFEQFGDRDLTRMITENYEVETGFGSFSVYNEEGRCGLRFRAAADQLTQSGGEEEQWTFKLDIGDAGDYFLMEICTADGKTLSKVHLSADGRVTWLSTNGMDIIDGGDTPSHQEYASTLLQKILGELKHHVAGNVTQIYESSRSTSISETDKKIVGHNDSTSINNHHIMSVGGNQQIQINGGSPLEATPLNLAVDMQILNGSYFLELGNPLAGANPLAQAGFTIAVNNGDIVFGQNPDPLALPAQKATVSLNTLLPNSVALGGTTSPLTTNPALMHAVMYEPLMTLLVGMMALFDSHVHLPPVGGPPATSMAASFSSLISTFMSLRVLIGG